MRKNCTPGEAMKSFKVIKSEAWDDPDPQSSTSGGARYRNFQSMRSHPGGGIYCCALLTVLVLQPVMSRSRCSASHQAWLGLHAVFVRRAHGVSR